MSDSIIVALIGFAGTVLVALIGLIATLLQRQRPRRRSDNDESGPFVSIYNLMLAMGMVNGLSMAILFVLGLHLDWTAFVWPTLAAFGIAFLYRPR